MEKLFFCWGIFLFSLHSVFAQNPSERLVTASYLNSPLRDVLAEMQAKHRMDFFYKQAWITDIVVTGDFKNISLSDFLENILKPHEISFLVYGTNIVLIKGESTIHSIAFRESKLDEQGDLGEYLKIGKVMENPGQQEVTISGFIREGGNDEALIGAGVYVNELKTGVTTNINGFYSLRLPVGKYTLTAGFIGYDEKSQAVEVLSNGNLSFSLYKETVELEEVTITAEAKDENIKGVLAGKEKLSIEAIKGMPAFLGEIDVVKSIITLPGVSTVGEGAAGFNVRGGSVDQNLLLLDDAMVFNASHLFGFFSAFNADFVRDVTLYKGGGPPNFGGRVSSILNVSLRNGNRQEFHGQGGLGLVSSRLVVEGPIVKDKTAFIIGGRSSYSDWILGRIQNVDLQESSAQFYDANAKLTHDFSDKDKLILSSYISNDRFKFAGDTIYQWRTINTSLKWNHIFNEKLLASFGAIYGTFKNKTFDDQDFDAFTLDSEITSANLKLDFNYIPDRKHKVDFGASIIRYEFNPGVFVPGEQNTNEVPLTLKQEQSYESGIYVKDEFMISPRLTIMYGLRYSMFHNVGPGNVFVYEPDLPREEETITDTMTFNNGELIRKYDGLEPRLSLRYSLDRRSSLKFSYYRTRQYIHLISNTTAIAPVDFWQTSNHHLQPQTGDQVSLGYFRNFKDDAIETSVEVYYKEVDNVLDYKEGSSILLNPTLEADLLSGKGRAYGLEVLLQKNKGRITGWIGYTYSRSELLFQSENEEERINLGEYYPANFDKPHDVTIVANFNASRRFKISTNFTYSTGRPITVPVSKYSYGNILSVLNYSERNQFRIPDYHRLDLSFTLKPGHRKQNKLKGEWVFSVYNVYGRKNPYSVFFRQSGQAFRLAVLGTVFPSVTYNFKF